MAKIVVAAVDMPLAGKIRPEDLKLAEWPADHLPLGAVRDPKEVIDRLNRGEEVDPASYYFRTTPYFETSSEKYIWLNRICAIATGSRIGDRRGFQVYEVL